MSQIEIDIGGVPLVVRGDIDSAGLQRTVEFARAPADSDALAKPHHALPPADLIGLVHVPELHVERS